MNGNRRVIQCLCVCVAEYEGHVVDTFAIHVVHSVTATATNTNHLDDAVLFFGLTEI